MNNINKIIFFHVTKCAGSSIERALVNHYGEKSVKSPATVLDYLISPPNSMDKNYKVLAGHITHDTAIPYIDNNSFCFTVLREPKSRIRSLYNYFKRINVDDEASVLAKSLSFHDWLNSKRPAILIQIQNSMIRSFTPESYWMVNRPACPELIRDYAVKFVSKFNLIGFVENFSNFSFNFFNATGVALDPNHLENFSINDYTDDVDESELEEWMNNNSNHDIFFYDYLVAKYNNPSAQIVVG